jgi:hypothetical protein
VRRWLRTLDDAGRAEAARVFARHQGEDYADLLVDLLDEAKGRQALAIIDAIGRSKLLPCTPALVRRLGDPNPTIRNRAAAALGRLTGLRYVDDWTALHGDALERMRRKWSRTWDARRHFSREDWLLQGFRQAGYDVGRFEPKQAWPLVAALSGPPHLAANAASQLQLLFGRRRSCTSWRRWLTARRSAFGLPPAPTKLCG